MMNAIIVRLLPADEQALLKCYIEGTSEPSGVDAIYNALEVPTEATPPRLAIAVAQILLHEVQGTLPQWAAFFGERVILNRKAHKRHEDARLSFTPHLICTINWAQSGPDFSRQEAYHVTYLPGFDKCVVTVSRDGPDVWGCADHAIGSGDGPGSAEAAKEIIIEYWRSQNDDWEQPRWACIFEEGLVDEESASLWADQVWPEADEMDEDEDS
jgi:hypothetical protein